MCIFGVDRVIPGAEVTFEDHTVLLSRPDAS